MIVSELIEHLQDTFDGDEEVWIKITNEFYSELFAKNVVSGSVYDMQEDIEHGPVCIIGEGLEDD
jgi:hypothetical protein